MLFKHVIKLAFEPFFMTQRSTHDPPPPCDPPPSPPSPLLVLHDPQALKNPPALSEHKKSPSCDKDKMGKLMHIAVIKITESQQVALPI